MTPDAGTRADRSAPQTLRMEVADGVALVTLDRPPVNALNRQMRREIVATFDAIAEREDIRCVVLTAAGKVFCAGADLKDRPAADIAGDYLEHNRITRETTNAIRECAKPVIAAVNGAALGAGLALMAACDILYASEEATFAMPEINVGLAGGAAMLKTGQRRLRGWLVAHAGRRGGGGRLGAHHAPGERGSRAPLRKQLPCADEAAALRRAATRSCLT